MNEALYNLTSRCSTKKYTDRQVSDGLLDPILDAGLYAATGRGVQHVIMVAVRDKATRDQLSRMNGRILGSGPDSDPFYNAPCVVVVLGDPSRNTWVEDGSLVLGNLMSAANAVGLGSCWIHRAKEMFSCDEGKALLRKWGLPEHLEGIGNCILGYPDGEPAKKPRQQNRIYKVD